MMLKPAFFARIMKTGSVLIARDPAFVSTVREVEKGL